MAEETIVLPWNDADMLESTLKCHGDEIATNFVNDYSTMIVDAQ